jgi:Cof subfamily protein (haloacid dehalogenase superfamily)
METAKQKAIFLDLDGTLLNDQKEVTEENQKTIARMLEKGHKVVITTGRPLVSAIKQAEKLGLTTQGCYLIAYNGGVIYDTGNRKILFQKTIPLELVKKVFAEANRLGIHIQTYNDTDVLVEPRNDNANVRRYCQLINMEHQVIPSVEDLEQPPVKMLLINYEEASGLEQFRQWVLSWAEGQLESFFSCGQYLEVVATGLSKGNALLQLAELLGIPKENTVSVGDAANDLPMIKAAQVGVAMVNGTAEVKAAANYITVRDNNHSGVAEVIQKFILG